MLWSKKCSRKNNASVLMKSVMNLSFFSSHQCSFVSFLSYIFFWYSRTNTESKTFISHKERKTSAPINRNPAWTRHCHLCYLHTSGQVQWSQGRHKEAKTYQLSNNSWLPRSQSNHISLWENCSMELSLHHLAFILVFCLLQNTPWALWLTNDKGNTLFDAVQKFMQQSYAKNTFSCYLSYCIKNVTIFLSTMKCSCFF